MKKEIRMNFSNKSDASNQSLGSERGASRRDVASEPKADLSENGSEQIPLDEGVESSNTTPSNLQCLSLTASDTLTTGGLDWLSLSLHGSFSDQYWSILPGIMHTARKHAEEGNDTNAFINLAPGINVLVAPSGKGKGRTYCKWKFQYQGLTFGIRDSQKAVYDQKHIPNVFIDIPSFPLMKYGEKEVMNLVEFILGAIGYQYERMAPSRVDLCVDLVDVSMHEISAAVQNNCIICSPRKNTTTCDKNTVETIRFGSPTSNTILRIYNKYEETENDQNKRKLLREIRWGKEPNPAVGAIRVEFQVRRDHLRDQHSIFTYDDLIKKRKSLARWLTYDWFRITEEEPDPNHTERYCPSRLWQKVRDAFDSWTGENVELRAKRISVSPNVDQLKSQAIGCLTSAIALAGDSLATSEELERRVISLLRPEYQKMIHDTNLKQLIYEAERPFKVSPS